MRKGSMIVKPNGRDIIIENAHHSNGLLVEAADIPDLFDLLKNYVESKDKEHKDNA